MPFRLLLVRWVGPSPSCVPRAGSMRLFSVSHSLRPGCSCTPGVRVSEQTNEWLPLAAGCQQVGSLAKLDQVLKAASSPLKDGSPLFRHQVDNTFCSFFPSSVCMGRELDILFFLWSRLLFSPGDQQFFPICLSSITSVPPPPDCTDQSALPASGITGDVRVMF